MLDRRKSSIYRGRPRFCMFGIGDYTFAPWKVACQWVTDISWLPGPVKGLFYYLYFVMDLYSRKIVGYEVYEEESSKHLGDVVARAVLGVAGTPRILALTTVHR